MSRPSPALPPASRLALPAGYRLAPGVHSCLVDGQAIFLDLQRQKYLCLPYRLNTSFLALVENSGRAAVESAAVDLVKLGLLVDAPDGMIDLAPLAPSAERDLGHADGRHSPWQIWRSLVALTCFERHLGSSSLQHVLDTMPGRKERRDGKAPEFAVAIAVARGFRDLARFRRMAGQCLPLSLALADRLRRCGFAPAIILGVRATPFAAHAWVVLDGIVMSDTLDETRVYTPILVIR